MRRMLTNILLIYTNVYYNILYVYMYIIIYIIILFNSIANLQFSEFERIDNKLCMLKIMQIVRIQVFQRKLSKIELSFFFSPKKLHKIYQ